MQVIPVSSRSEVADANDLKPLRVRLLRYTSDGLLWGGGEQPHSTGEERCRRGTRPAGGSVASPVSGCAVLAALGACLARPVLDEPAQFL